MTQNLDFSELILDNRYEADSLRNSHLLYEPFLNYLKMARIDLDYKYEEVDDGIPEMFFNVHSDQYKRARRDFLLLVWFLRYRKIMPFDEEAVIEHNWQAWTEDFAKFA